MILYFDSDIESHVDKVKIRFQIISFYNYFILFNLCGVIVEACYLVAGIMQIRQKTDRHKQKIVRGKMMERASVKPTIK